MSVELRPGQTLNLVLDVERETLLGTKVVTQVTESLTYEQILDSFRSGKEPKKRFFSTPPEAKEFNRVCSVTMRCYETGKNIRGHAVDVKVEAAKLVERMKALSPEMLTNVSVKAREKLEAIASHKLTKAEHKKEIKEFLAKFAPAEAD
jgi:DNA phosphorothioation-dependent restriction protein DptG